MKKFMLLFAASLFLTSCHDKDEMYYWNHPDVLRQQLQQCIAHAPSQSGLSCEELQTIADMMQVFAYELQQQGPQKFGQKILALQQQIASQELNLKKAPNQTALEKEIEANKRQLAQRLAIVKQFESPEG